MSVPAYRLLFYSSAIVIFGVMGQAVARGWLARDLTGNNAGLGAVMLVFGASMLLSTPLGGVAADRYPKRRVLLFAVIALVTSSLTIGVAVIGDVIHYWMLLVASGVQAVAFAFYLPSRISLISEIVPRSLLQNAVVLTQMSQEAMRVFAPALAGVLIGVTWFGVGGVFIASGVASAIACGFVAALPRQAPRWTALDGSPFGSMIDAVRYVRDTHEIGLIALVTVGVVMVGFPYLTFLPTLADDRFDVGAIGYGAMSGVVGLGAIAAGFLNASGRQVRRPWTMIRSSGALFGFALIALGLANSFVLALVALAVIGGSGLTFQTSTQSLLLRLSDPDYHGRLQGLVVLGFSGFGLMALPLGLLADEVSLRTTLATMGTAVLAIMVSFAAVHHRRRARLKTLEVR